MTDIQIRKQEPQDDEILEEWVRVTDSLDLLGVDAVKIDLPEWPWQVSLYVAEFVREESLERKMDSMLVTALKNLPGVLEVVREDREVWLVNGNIGGEALVRACAQVVDNLLPETRTLFEDL